MLIKSHKIVDFSIIIPCYNCEQYITKSIDLILSISNIPQNFEILIIDDKSTDNTLEILKEFHRRDNRIRVFENSISKGPNFSRNIGIKNSIGKNILFLDSDDQFNANSLSAAFQFALKMKGEIGVLGIEFITSKQKILKIFQFKNEISTGEMALEQFFEGKIPTVCWNKIYSRKFLLDNNIKFVEDKVHGRDAIFTVNCLINSNTVQFSELILVQSLVRDDSFSRSFSLQNIKSALVIVEDVKKLCDENLVSSHKISMFILKYIRYIFILSFFRLRTYKEITLANELIGGNHIFQNAKRESKVRINKYLLQFLIIQKATFILYLFIKALKKIKIQPY